jgi:DNA-binding transcriptional ArsR family regulator
MKAATQTAAPELHPNLEEAARSLESLGNTTRLSIYRLLVKAGPAGLPVGEIQRRLAVPASTLSHHLANLVQNGLLIQVREGRVLRCMPDFDQMSELLRFLTDECCREAGGGECGPDACSNN